jgi:hypothetical protein
VNHQWAQARKRNGCLSVRERVQMQVKERSGTRLGAGGRVRLRIVHDFPPIHFAHRVNLGVGKTCRITHACGLLGAFAWWDALALARHAVACSPPLHVKSVPITLVLCLPLSLVPCPCCLFLLPDDCLSPPSASSSCPVGGQLGSRFLQ